MYARIFLYSIFLILLSGEAASKGKSTPRSAKTKQKENSAQTPSVSTKAVQEKDNRIKAKSSITDHRNAYLPKPGRGEHIDIKVTPPENGRGKPGYVLVEVYNNSNFSIHLISFDIKVVSKTWEEISSQIVVEDMAPQWSDARWLQVPKNMKLPKFEAIEVNKVEIYGHNQAKIKLPVYSSLVNK